MIGVLVDGPCSRVGLHDEPQFLFLNGCRIAAFRTRLYLVYCRCREPSRDALELLLDRNFCAADAFSKRQTDGKSCRSKLQLTLHRKPEDKSEQTTQPPLPSSSKRSSPSKIKRSSAQRQQMKTNKSLRHRDKSHAPTGDGRAGSGGWTRASVGFI
ncbi:hypothetical protein BJX68DRAFT_120062 [Aspergillus pseudodeflectus]|uniref:Uncharacterized protein n=1 Tax=Aspergillus pseudodeflectus TaxID=176178 RepID=A0ABR4K444_9EURO